MSFDLATFIPLMLVAVFWLLVEPALKRERNAHRTLIAALAAGFGLRYMGWRLFRTVLPAEGVSTAHFWWIVLVFVVEVLAFTEVCLFLLIMSRTNTRDKEADAYEKDMFRHPTVDVFIPTYNEGLDVLEKTIVGAKHLDYPSFKIWVLDDGRRVWLRDFCAEKNVGYMIRSDNVHAKAGNLNNGLAETSGELFAIFDADFVPARNFLRRTVGFFIHNEDIGVVQTPQHFFNKDPIQSNLYLDKVWPDEQRLFFDAMAPCRDSWDAAFCCGSCSIIRRAAVDKVGGIPTSSITEDLLTTLVLLTVNYRTVYLNEKLSQGMAAQSIEGYFIQRARWCRGGIQCFFVKEGPLRAKGLSFFQRVLFTPYGWAIQPVTRMMMVTIPIVYLWLGVAPLHYTTAADIFSYQIPMLAMFTMTMLWLAPRKYVPLISTAVGVFGMFRLLPVVISSFIKPFGEPFRVTPKGQGSKTGVDWPILTAASVLVLLTLSGMMINLVAEYRVLGTMAFFPYALVWSAVNVLLLVVCLLACFDSPRRRREERFFLDEPTTVNGVSCEFRDISLGGCRIAHSEGKRVVEKGDVVEIPIAEVSVPLKAEVKNSNAREFACEFIDIPSPQRDELIGKLFTGRYDNAVREIDSVGSVIASLFRRALGKERR